MNIAVLFNYLYSIIQFISETESVLRCPWTHRISSLLCLTLNNLPLIQVFSSTQNQLLIVLTSIKSVFSPGASGHMESVSDCAYLYIICLCTKCSGTHRISFRLCLPLYNLPLLQVLRNTQITESAPDCAYLYIICLCSRCSGTHRISFWMCLPLYNLPLLQVLLSTQNQLLIVLLQQQPMHWK